MGKRVRGLLDGVTPIKAAGLLALTITIISLVANVMQLGQNIPAWATVGIAVGLVVLVALVAKPILRKNPRGVRLFSAVGATGLLDVEHRFAEGHRLPPENILKMDGIRTILVSGVLDQLFQAHMRDVRDFLRGGGNLRVLMIHPERVLSSLSSSWTRHSDDWTTYWISNCNEAQAAVDAILLARLDEVSGFEMRFLQELPPLLGILAIEGTSLDDAGRRSLIRIQPLTASKWIGRGTVLTFCDVLTHASGDWTNKDLAAVNYSPFTYFADDLLAQWNVAVPDQDYLQRRRAELHIDR